MALISPHLDESELACHDGTPYPFDMVDEFDPAGRVWRVTRAALLASMFEKIRTGCGGAPIVIISAFRTVGYQGALKSKYPDNPAVASANGSQHPQGRALDMRHSVMTARAFHDRILQMFLNGDLPELGGLGAYPTFVHGDVRTRPPSGHLAQWADVRPDSQV